MSERLFWFFGALVLTGLFIWLMSTIAGSGPHYRCVDGVMYENYMTGDVWVKTQKLCVGIK